MSEGPFTSMTDAAQHLRRPFTPEAVKWKIQTSLGGKGAGAKGGLIVAYIDARLVIERLNLLCPEWRDFYEPGAKGMRCDLTVCGVTRSGFGEGRDLKASESDALKRAGVKFGVGVSLYAMASVTLWRAEGKEPAGNKLRPNFKGELELDDHNRKWLADMYGKWLDTPRGKTFGEPLDHGDEFGAVGDPEDTAPVTEPGEDLSRLQEDVEVAYLGLGKDARRALPPGKYKARLEQARDEDGLRALLSEIQSLNEKAAA